MHASIRVTSSCGLLVVVLLKIERTWAGIILGMCLFGAIGDTIGRRMGSIGTACIMLLGAALLISQDGASPKGFTVFYIISQFVFG